jgi:hypothetical protein
MCWLTFPAQSPASWLPVWTISGSAGDEPVRHVNALRHMQRCWHKVIRANTPRVVPLAWRRLPRIGQGSQPVPLLSLDRLLNVPGALIDVFEDGVLDESVEPVRVDRV